MSDDADKKNAPSDLRRRQAREEGRVARSHLLGPAVVLLTLWSALGALETTLLSAFARALERSLSEPLVLASQEFDVKSFAWRTAGPWILAIAPILGSTLAAAWIAHFTQCGWVWLPNQLAPDWTRWTPAAAWQRVASLANLWRSVLALLQLSTLACCLGMTVNTYGSEIVASREPSLALAAYGLWRVGLELVRNVALSWLTLAILDYGIQRWLLERSLQMTDDEVREENRRTQGDPHVRRQRRQAQRALSSERIASTPATSSATSPDSHRMQAASRRSQTHRTQPASAPMATDPGKL